MGNQPSHDSDIRRRVGAHYIGRARVNVCADPRGQIFELHRSPNQYVIERREQFVFRFHWSNTMERSDNDTFPVGPNERHIDQFVDCTVLFDSVSQMVRQSQPR